MHRSRQLVHIVLGGGGGQSGDDDYPAENAIIASNGIFPV